MAQAATQQEEHFGELTQLANLTRDFMDACNQNVQAGAAKFNIVKGYILRNSDVDENGAINIIFHAMVKASKDNTAIPSYKIGVLTHVFASGYSESNSVLQALANIGQEAKQPASHLKIVKS
jgi:hypothetical protein